MFRIPWMSVCMMVLLAGCADIAPAGEGGEEGGGDDSTVKAGEVTVAQQNGRFKAMRTEIGTPSFSPGQDVSAVTVNGAISITAGSSARVTASMWAWGDTEQQARSRLQTLRLELSGPGVDAAVRATDGSWSDKGGSLQVRLSSDRVGAVTADTTNGAVAIEGLRAGDVSVDTTNAAVTCDLSAPSLTIDTTNGAVACSGTFDDLDIDATNGAISVDAKAARSGTWSIDTTNGMIELTVVEDAQRGYDVQAETTNGQIVFDFEDTDEVDSSSSYVAHSRHERTRDYASRSIQTSVSLDASNAGIVAGS